MCQRFVLMFSHISVSPLICPPPAFGTVGTFITINVKQKKKIIAVRQNTEDMSAPATANESSFPVRVCLAKGFFLLLR